MTCKKRFLAISTALFLFFGVRSSNIPDPNRYRKNFVIKKGSVKYSRGTIYIASSDELDKMTDLEEGDVLVEDGRNDSDPDLRVRGSRYIHNFDVREEIIEGLLAYEEVFPTDWERTKESMDNEWDVHNFLSTFNYQTNRTNDVDFNNKDEEKFKIKILSIFR